MAPDGDAEILTLAGRAVLTTIVIGADTAGLPLTQVRLEVILTLITSPLASVVEV